MMIPFTDKEEEIIDKAESVILRIVNHLEEPDVVPSGSSATSNDMTLLQSVLQAFDHIIMIKRRSETPIPTR